MGVTQKFSKLIKTERDEREIGRWIMSLAPLTLAFVFFVVFLTTVEIANKDVLYVIGGTAGFAGLQTYWIIRGWQRNEGTTVLLGVIGIAFAVAIAWSYIFMFRGGLA